MQLIGPHKTDTDCTGWVPLYLLSTLDYYIMAAYKYNVFIWGQFDLDYI